MQHPSNNILIIGRQPEQEIVRSNVLSNNDLTRQQERTRTRAQQNLEADNFGKGLFIHYMCSVINYMIPAPSEKETLQRNLKR